MIGLRPVMPTDDEPRYEIRPVPQRPFGLRRGRCEEIASAIFVHTGHLFVTRRRAIPAAPSTAPAR
jgi:hypothetical protein